MSIRSIAAIAIAGSAVLGRLDPRSSLPIAAAQQSLPPTPADTANYRVVKLADGIYTFVAPAGITPIVSGNSTVIIGDDAALVVDTGQFPSIARWEIGRIKALTTKRVRYIVNTHWHPDHWLGNGAFRAAYPEATIVSTEATSRAMHDDAQPFLDPKISARTRDAIDRMLTTGKGPQGTPLSDADRAWYRYGATEARALLPELERLEVAYPTLLFGTELTVKLGNRDAQIRFLGRGNTAGDAVVYVPDAKVLVAGDLLVHPYPYGFGSFISEWIATLGQLGSLGATTIVPGHGGVQHDRAYLDQVVELLGFVLSEARARSGEGSSLEDATRRIDVDRYERSMCPTDPYCRYGFRTSLNATIARAYQEAKDGKLANEK
jgi:glyoxylase-like metal-dependent hydrolase (beta-lactamase superfamily II)